MMGQTLYYAALAAAVIFPVSLLLLFAQLWAQRQHMGGQQRSILMLQSEVQAMQLELAALCAGGAGAGAHLGRMERQLSRLGERQNRLELSDTMNREYERAVKLLREGMSVEQVMVQCNLVRAEAELLARMNATVEEPAPRRRIQPVPGSGMRVSGVPM